MTVNFTKLNFLYNSNVKNKIRLTKHKNRIICFLHTKVNFLYTKSILNLY